MCFISHCYLYRFGEDVLPLSESAKISRKVRMWGKEIPSPYLLSLYRITQNPICTEVFERMLQNTRTKGNKYSRGGVPESGAY